MSMERVALFLPSLGGGGAERVMVNLAEGFAERGLSVDLVLVKREGPYLAQVPSKVHLVDLGAGRVRASLPRLVSYLRQNRPDALLSAMDHANIVALWARRLAGTPTRVIVSLHNTPSEKLRNWPFLKKRISNLMLRCFYPWADGIVAVSNGVADDYVHTTGIQSNRISIIYNPVITPALYKKAHEPFEHPWLTPKEPPVILSVGRLTEQKDYSTLIRAFAKVREKRPARLLILGEGELRKDLESLMRKLHLENDMALPGFVKNPYQYMAKASVFALSSKWEGLPTVLIEALAIGIPVVSTNCKSGPDEILRNGRLGKLVPVGEVMALADAISESLSKSKPNIRCETLEQFERSWAIEEYLKILKGESCE